MGPDLTSLTNCSERRKQVVRECLAQWRFPDGGGRFDYVIDAFHGETGLCVASAADTALDRAWREVKRFDAPDDYTDRVLYDKRQPLVLRELAAQRLFGRFLRPAAGLSGVRVYSDNVIVCPYSSTLMLEAAIATLMDNDVIPARDGVIVCPEGFYKSASIHVEKCGLRIVTCPAADDSLRIDPAALQHCLGRYRQRGQLRGVLLTLPGNPVVARYSVAEMMELGQVLADCEVPIICDMAFDLIVDDYVPIGALTVPTKRGPVRLFDRVLSITGNSKAYNAFGPCKMGAACTGETRWLKRLREQLTTAFQRETTHLARAIIEHTPNSYFEYNRRLMCKRQARARALVNEINDRFGAQVLRPMGNAEGMFLSIEFDRELLAGAGVKSSAVLEDLLLIASGIDSVALDRTGSTRLGVRLNVVTPRKDPGRKPVDLLDELFSRIEGLLQRIDGGLTYTDILEKHKLAPVVAT